MAGEVTAPAPTPVDCFVAQVRARRAADGRPDHIDAESVYRLLDGLLARNGDGDESD
jgi:hypothetical protein